MRRFIVNDIPAFSTQLLELSSQVDVYSFDIFDTLLARRIDPPEYIHGLHAEYVAEKLGHSDSSEILAIRYLEESKLRQKSLEKGFDRECHFYDILTAMASHFVDKDHTDEFAQWMREKELFLEEKALFVLPGITRMLTGLRNTGKTIVALSDMYLGAEDVEYLMRQKGLLEYFDAVKVSSENKRCKYSGRMFRDLRKEYNTHFDRMFHAGDNKIADFKVPLRLGMRAALFRSNKEKRRRASLGLYEGLARKRDFWKGRYLAQIAFTDQRCADLQDQDFYYHYGHNVLSPIYCALVQALISYIEDHDIKHVYFLARDGYLLQKIYNRLVGHFAPEQPERVKSDYIHLTRQSVAQASVWNGLDFHKASLPLKNKKQQGLLSILKAYSLPIADFECLAERHGFKQIAAPISALNDPRLASFLSDPVVQEKIKEHGRSARELLRKYLKQTGFFSHDRVAFVDIGWNGTIQYFVAESLKSEALYPNVFGLYFTFCGGLKHSFPPSETIHGFFYDARNQDISEQIAVGFEELFEESCKAGHTTTIGYKENHDGSIGVIHKDENSPDRIIEKQSDPIVSRIQKGIVDFIPAYIDAICLTRYSFDELKPFLLFLIERAVAYPSAEEVKMLTRLAHTEDWGHDNLMDLEKIAKNSFWTNVRGSLRNSNWIYGTLRIKVGNFAVFIFRLMMIFKGGIQRR